MAIPGLDSARSDPRLDALPDGIVVHSRGVARVATAAATWSRRRGVPVDVRLVEVAALLHDIDKPETRRTAGARHPGRARLTMGYPELAMPVASHPVTAPARRGAFPARLAVGLVSVADRHVHQEFVTIDERIDDCWPAHPSTRDEVGAARPPAHALKRAGRGGGPRDR